jgi:hypothetical protein
VVAAGAALQARSAGFADAGAAVAVPVHWEGPAGEAYAAHAGRLSADLAAAGDALTATARLTDETGAWIERTRTRVATVVAEALASAEAVAVVLGTDDAARAAATIATRILSTLDTAIADGETVSRGPRPEIGAIPPARTALPADYERITRLGG